MSDELADKFESRLRGLPLAPPPAALRSAALEARTAVRSAGAHRQWIMPAAAVLVIAAAGALNALMDLSAATGRPPGPAPGVVAASADPVMKQIEAVAGRWPEWRLVPRRRQADPRSILMMHRQLEALSES